MVGIRRRRGLLLFARRSFRCRAFRVCSGSRVYVLIRRVAVRVLAGWLIGLFGAWGARFLGSPVVFACRRGENGSGIGPGMRGRGYRRRDQVKIGAMKRCSVSEPGPFV